MGKDPWFPFYYSDWLGSTKRAMMTPAERGAYIDLLSHQWADPTCSLPDDDDVLAALSGLGEGWLANGSRVLRGCFPKHPTLQDRIANPRMLEVRAARDEWRRKSSKGGKKSQQVQAAKRAAAKAYRNRKGGSATLATKRQPKGEPNGNLPLPSPCIEKTTSSRRAFSFDQEDAGLAAYIWEKVQVVKPQQKPPNLEAWANEIRLMRERDDRTHEEIRDLFDWANADEFWDINIGSPAKLREKWADLDARRRKQSEQPARKHRTGLAEDRLVR